MAVQSGTEKRDPTFLIIPHGPQQDMSVRIGRSLVRLGGTKRYADIESTMEVRCRNAILAGHLGRPVTAYETTEQ